MTLSVLIQPVLTVEESEAPSGMLARGKFSVSSKFVDDDSNVHLEFDWTVDIRKDWDK